MNVIIRTTSRAGIGETESLALQSAVQRYWEKNEGTLSNPSLTLETKKNTYVGCYFKSPGELTYKIEGCTPKKNPQKGNTAKDNTNWGNVVNKAIKEGKITKKGAFYYVGKNQFHGKPKLVAALKEGVVTL